MLGAGISQPSGLYSADELTRLLLEEPYHEYAGAYYRGEGPLFRRERLSSFKEAFGLILSLCSRERERVEGKKGANYEDVLAAAENLSSTISGSYVGPGWSAILEEVRGELERLAGTAESLNLYDFLHGLSSFIRTASASLLSGHDLKPVGYDFIRSLYNDLQPEHTTIVTLNHDNLLERYLDSEKIPDEGTKVDGRRRVDGFPNQDGGVSWFEPTDFWKSHRGKKMTLVKLHGSVDWFQFRGRIEHGQDDFTARVDEGWSEEAYDSRGRRLHCTSFGPVILAGDNKELLYNSGDWSVLYQVFIDQLRQANHVITSGFSWNDLGVSLSLLAWLEGKAERRIVILHAAPEEFKSSSRGSRLSGFRRLLETGRIIIHPHFMMDVDWPDVAGLFR